MLYHVLLVLNHIVTRQAECVSKESIDRVVPEFPYRQETDYGNPLARMMRERDHILERGYNGIEGFKSNVMEPVTSAEVVYVDDSLDVNGQCLFYMFKWYENGTFSPNPYMTEEQRLEMAKEYYAGMCLPLNRDRQVYIQIQYDDVKDYYTQDEYTTLVAKKRAHENFTQAEMTRNLGIVMSMPTDLSVRMRYWFATTANNTVLASIGFTTSETYKKDMNAYHPHTWAMESLDIKRQKFQEACFWFDTLVGTELEYVAATLKMETLLGIEQEDDAVDLIKGLLSRSNLPQELRPILEDKVKYLGYGRNAYNEILRLYNNKQYGDVVKKCDEWLNPVTGATGITRLYLNRLVLLLKDECWNPTTGTKKG